MNSKYVPALHPKFCYNVHHVGNESFPVLVVDNFLDQPEFLIYLAEKYSSFKRSRKFYPGVESLAPDFYSKAIYFYLGDLICSTFGFSRERISQCKSTFAIITTPPEQLLDCQARPHIDSPSSLQVAAVHYLCSSSHGGTSLYRHRATGFESLTENRLAEVSACFPQEVNDNSWMGCYINGSNDYYEQIASFDAAFNRIVMYPSNCLHSGNIGTDFKFDPNPRTGRLTLTTFVRCDEE